MKLIIGAAVVLGIIAVGVLFFKTIQESSQEEFIVPLPLRESYIQCITSFPNEKRETGTCLQKLSEYAVSKYAIPQIEQAVRNVDPRWCHEFMHYAGWVLYKEKENLTDSFIAASDDCDAGMRHGVVEEYISQKALDSDPENFVASVIPTACKKGIETEQLRVGAVSFCYHGLGHAFMFITNNNLPEALSYCDYLKDGFQEGCYTGAFMENISTKEVGRFGVHQSTHPYNTSDRDYPCSILETRYKDYCYVYKGIYNTNRYQVPKELKKAFEDCSMVEAPYREKCWWGVGNNLPGPGILPSIVGERCNIAMEVGTEVYEQCIWGAAKFLGQLHWDNPKAFVDFCDAIKTSHKETCYRASGKNLRSWSASEAEFVEKCQYFTGTKARELCEHFET